MVFVLYYKLVINCAHSSLMLPFSYVVEGYVVTLRSLSIALRYAGKLLFALVSNHSQLLDKYKEMSRIGQDDGVMARLYVNMISFGLTVSPICRILAILTFFPAYFFIGSILPSVVLTAGVIATEAILVYTAKGDIRAMQRAEHRTSQESSEGQASGTDDTPTKPTDVDNDITAMPNEHTQPQGVYDGSSARIAPQSLSHVQVSSKVGIDMRILSFMSDPGVFRHPAYQRRDEESQESRESEESQAESYSP